MESIPNERFIVLDTAGGRERTTLSLRFFGVDLDPDEVTQALGVKATKSARRGEMVRILYTGSLRQQSSWHYTIEDESGTEPEKLILDLLRALPDDLTVWKRLTDTSDGSLFCGVFWRTDYGEINLSPECLSVVAERGLRLTFDTYYFGDEDETGT